MKKLIYKKLFKDHKNRTGMHKSWWKQAWHFFWHEDSVASWIVNLVVAFFAIKFIVYPLLGLLFGTSFPIVAVISESMEHGLHNGILCGQRFESFPYSFDNYWNVCGYWYEDRGIDKEQFQSFPFQDGFDKGDVIILWRANNLKVGDILVFQADRPQPIIHRIVHIGEEDGKPSYQTKGDHNIQSYPFESDITPDALFGKAVFRIPYLGYVKIWFVEILQALHIISQQ